MKKILRLLGLLCLFSGLTIILHNICFSYSISRNSRNELDKLIDNIEKKEISLNSTIEMDIVIQDEHSYIGYLNIDAIGIELPVLYDYSYELMSIAPTRYKGTYFDSMIICAHNTSSHFGKIDQLNIGDKITFTDVNNNEYVYKVVLTEILEKDDFEKMENSKYDLTLFTCTLDAQRRTTVRANKS